MTATGCARHYPLPTSDVCSLPVKLTARIAGECARSRLISPSTAYAIDVNEHPGETPQSRFREILRPAI